MCGRIRSVATVVVVATLAAAACTTSEPAPSTTTTLAPTTTTTTLGVLVPDAQAVFAAASPSLAFIETEVGTGSGILIEGGLIVTAAHVVWPQRSVRVVFPNGAERRRAPVIAVDPIADIAVVDVSAMSGLPAPATVGDLSTVRQGAPVFLIGYPGETESFPQPTISQGIVSRFREWAPADWSFIQTDATTIGGQSGGAVVSSAGEVLGLTNFLLGGEFGVSAALDDVLARVDRLLAGEDVGGLGDRLPPVGGEVTEATAILEHYYDAVTYVIEAPLFTDVSITVRSDLDAGVAAIAPDGFIEAASSEPGDFQEIGFTVNLAAAHFLEVRSFSVGGQGVTVRSSVPMVPYPDEDDGRRIEFGETLAGSIDYPGEFDWYVVDLLNGQAVTVEVDSVAFDPSLTVDTADNVGEALAFDADRGGGLFGWNPRVTYTARQSGEHLLIVEDLDFTGPGAYFISIED